MADDGGWCQPGTMSAKRVVAVIGAGPAALAAAHRLRAESEVQVRMIAPEGMSDYLAGSLAVATGDAEVSRFRTPLRIPGVEVIPASAESIGAGRVVLERGEERVDAVVAAPGLWTDDPDPSASLVGFWDLSGAAAAAPAILAVDSGVVSVVIGSPLYRCPPAPYGLAVRLARRAERLGLPVRVRLTTPESRPLAAVGSAVTDLLIESCADAGVEIVHDFLPDPDALGRGEVIDRAGGRLETDLAVVVPPHRAHPLLAEVAGPSHMVETDANGRCGVDRLYVAGDAASGPFPRAVSPAIVSGVAAAEGALVDLGLLDHSAPQLPEPDCFVDQGEGNYSRIQISYPSGPPPSGVPSVVVGPVTSAANGGFEDARRRWREFADPTA